MGDEKKTLLEQLIKLSKVDSSLAGIFAEKKRMEKTLAELASEFKKADQERQGKKKTYEEKKNRYQKEEKRLRDEQEKLVSRRKALTTLNNYKLQQAAEKEIEHASRQLGNQEEVLLGTLEEVDSLSSEVDKLDKEVQSFKERYSLLVGEQKETLVNLEQREQELQEQRLALVSGIDARSLGLYDKVRERFPMDAVAALKDSSCSGCYMQVGPQVVVQISRGDSLVRCPGCGRIVYLETEQAGA
ncbi:MAG: hypothetical protein J5J00_12490 [Deltaproteobacteria bacterium]|nr:hypothetical protein [Deltaproteobacteria bacterium]